MQSYMFGIFPASTGPALRPWNLWMVRANAKSSGTYCLVQQPFLQCISTLGIGTSYKNQEYDWQQCHDDVIEHQVKFTFGLSRSQGGPEYNGKLTTV